MKYLKSHFRYNKRQRNGILFLCIFIVLLQLVYFYFSSTSNKSELLPSSDLVELQKQIDSLKEIHITNESFTITPFNPNYISDFKGEQLGMSLEEINRLHAYRKQNKFINSAKEFQQVTQVSDSLLNKISAYFKFPDWVIAQNKKIKSAVKSNNDLKKIEKSDKTIPVSTNDINKATQQDLQTVNGIGDKLSARIVNYRARLQGFSYDYQLYEVWNIDSVVVKKVLNTFKIITKPKIKRININTATFKEVLKTPYIDYTLCKKIFEYRDQVAELQDISELKNIKGFPLNKYERIIIYLTAE